MSKTSLPWSIEENTVDLSIELVCVRVHCISYFTESDFYVFPFHIVYAVSLPCCQGIVPHTPSHQLHVCSSPSVRVMEGGCESRDVSMFVCMPEHTCTRMCVCVCAHARARLCVCVTKTDNVCPRLILLPLFPLRFSCIIYGTSHEYANESTCRER